MREPSPKPALSTVHEDLLATRDSRRSGHCDDSTRARPLSAAVGAADGPSDERFSHVETALVDLCMEFAFGGRTSGCPSGHSVRVGHDNHVVTEPAAGERPSKAFRMPARRLHTGSRGAGLARCDRSACLSVKVLWLLPWRRLVDARSTSNQIQLGALSSGQGDPRPKVRARTDRLCRTFRLACARRCPRLVPQAADGRTRHARSPTTRHAACCCRCDWSRRGGH